MPRATWEACGRAAAPGALMGQGQPGPGALPGVSKSGTDLETKGSSTPLTST